MLLADLRTKGHLQLYAEQQAGRLTLSNTPHSSPRTPAGGSGAVASVPASPCCLLPAPPPSNPLPPLPSPPIHTADSPWQEPFGLTLIEAAAHGVPIVATTHGGPVDIVATLRCGQLVEPTDTAAIAAAVTRIITDRQLWDRYSEAGRCVGCMGRPSHGIGGVCMGGRVTEWLAGA